jgi:hypothetical protein
MKLPKSHYSFLTQETTISSSSLRDVLPYTVEIDYRIAVAPQALPRLPYAP